jgi:hypothetical protein
MMSAITTKYLCPTNTKGSRIVATDDEGNRVIVGVDNRFLTSDQHRTAAQLLCKKMGWPDAELCEGVIRDGHVFVFCNHI